MVHRLARRVQHAALLSWRQAAQERKVRRTAIARFMQVRYRAVQCKVEGRMQAEQEAMLLAVARGACSCIASVHASPSPSRLPLALAQRWDAHRKAAALGHWRRLLAEKREAEEGLRRCLTRKRVAFRLFRQWYWESFDEDMQVGRAGATGVVASGRGCCTQSMPTPAAYSPPAWLTCAANPAPPYTPQETLRSMFEVAEGAALDPLPSRAASPYGSLLRCGSGVGPP